jgi:hypothetical protein
VIGVTITPSQIDYSKIITSEVVEKLIVGECVILTGFAKELVPVDTGQLKNSIMWATDKDEGGHEGGSKISKPPAETGYVGSSLEYAGPAEYGIKDRPKYPRQPYLRPAIDYSKRQREARQRGVIRTAIKEAYNGK